MKKNIQTTNKGNYNNSKGNYNNSQSIDLSTSIDTTLTEPETDLLIFMQQEEQLARDVYDELYEQWGISVFDKISDSEQNHMDSVTNVVEKYNIDSNIAIETGVFANDQLQSLYEDLMVKGSTSVEEALSVGALIEEVDIADLINAIATTDNPDLVAMYSNLLDASYNHLNAFVSQIESLGVEYEAQVLSAEELSAILSEASDTGSNNHGSGGNGTGGNSSGTHGHASQANQFYQIESMSNFDAQACDMQELVGVDYTIDTNTLVAI